MTLYQIPGRKNLIREFWPGPLTIVLKASLRKVKPLVRGGKKTLGIRVPHHKTSLLLIKEVGVPLLGPSANFQGEKTPFRFEDLNPNLISQVDFLLSGNTGSYKKPSTIIDCSIAPWKILRKGAAELNLRFKN